MNTPTRLIKEIVGSALLIGLMLSFFPNLTGLNNHQILGTALGALAVYHGWAHRGWIASIARRPLTGFNRGHVLWLLDGALALGFALIVGTGLLISTWLGLPADSLAGWTDVHVIGSITTLALVVIKVGLHWKWIVQSLTPVRPRSVAATTTITRAAVTHATGPTRRDFLNLMGVVSVAALAAGASAITGRYGQAQTVSADTNSVVADTASTSAGAAPTGTTITTAATATTTTITTAAAATTVATSTPAATATAVATATTPDAPVATACTVRCNRGCSYPGHCRRYSDSNGNGLCDLGECL